MTQHEPITAPKPRRRRWRQWALLVLVLLAATGFVFRGPLLRAPAEFLIVDEPLRPANYVLVLNGDDALGEAARLYRGGLAERVLLVDGRHRRLERLGILPTSVEIARRELTAMGVAPERIEVFDWQELQGWDYLRQLTRWLDARPDGHVTALVHQFGARDLQYRLRAVLPRAAWERIHLRTLPHRWYDESNWWRRKEGALSLYHEYLRLGYDALHGEDSEPWRDWDPAMYRAALPATP